MQETDYSFGIIPYRKNKQDALEFLVILNQSGHWHFPKGHAEAGESPIAAARRELLEEVGLGLGPVLNEEKPILENYTMQLGEQTIPRQLHLFVAEVIGEFLTIQKEEVADAQWLPPEDALRKVTFDSGKETLRQAIQLLS